MKIYTKKGDTGKTSLIGGTKVAKHHIRVEAYGTIDELNVCIGLVADQNIDAHSKTILHEIQDRLFCIGALLASDPGKSKMKIPQIAEIDITLLEKEIDAMQYILPEMKNFILPGGHTTVSFCHLARVVCRRAERIVSHLIEQTSAAPVILKYLNRLSDFLFVLARKFTHDMHIKEIVWKPRNT